MPTTVIGLFDDADQAQKMCQALSDQNIDAQNLILLNQDSKDIEGTLSEQGFEDYEIEAYAREAGEGGTVIVALVEDNKADQLIDLMHKHGAYEPEGLSEQENRQQQSSQQEQERSQSLKEVEENVEIGKRQIQKGGVRARTKVTETPIEETVSLREEKVDVEHRDVDKALSPQEAEKAFKEQSIEMQETAEETEVRKAARQIGEVNLTKTTDTREETVNEKERRTEVEVESVQGGQQRHQDKEKDKEKSGSHSREKGKKK